MDSWTFAWHTGQLTLTPREAEEEEAAPVCNPEVEGTEGLEEGKEERELVEVEVVFATILLDSLLGDSLALLAALIKAVGVLIRKIGRQGRQRLPRLV